MTRYAVRHETIYGYRTPVDMGLHVLRVTPLDSGGQRSLGQTLSILPEPARIDMFVDHFGNVVHHVAVETTHERLTATLEAVVEVAREPRGEAGPPWEEVRASMDGDGFPTPPLVAEFVYPSPLAPLEDATTLYAAECFAKGRPIVDGVRELASRIHADFAYMPNSTSVGTRIAEVIAMRRGVCQDFAHLMIAGLRGLGLPARYVSGYLHTHRGEDGSEVPGADASHAWVSAWCGEALGWIEIDPTNDLMVADEHVVVAYGRDFSDATPLRGVILGGGSHTLSVAVAVTALEADAEAN
jgi:transglutaminase-like putative cysteine protease